MGVIFAFVAAFSWGVGDFLIQRSAKKFGDGIALFCITAFATVFLFPFVVRDLPYLANVDYRFWLLLGASLVLLVAALLGLEAFRVGKISVVEPIYALEVPVTVALGSLFLSEGLSAAQGIFIATLMTGILFVSVKSLRVLRRFRLEKGVILAFFATLGLGGTNFLFGLGARHTSPLMINWFTSAFVALVMVGFLTYGRQWKALRRDWRRQKTLILSMSLFRNLAWVAFSFSALTIPIAIATGISECYIVLAAFLGLVWNREKLVTHQKIGLACAVLSAVVLGAISGG
jgi:drug/metabolite transporter (DMT)-like permease